MKTSEAAGIICSARRILLAALCVLQAQQPAFAELPSKTPAPKLDPAAAARVRGFAAEIRGSEQIRREAVKLGEVRSRVMLSRKAREEHGLEQESVPSVKPPTQEELRAVLRKLPIVMNDKRSVAAFAEDAVRAVSAAAQAREQEKRYPAVLIRHIRGEDQQTLPLPDKEKLRVRRVALEREAERKRGTRRWTWRPPPSKAVALAELPPCRTNGSKKISFGSAKGGPEKVYQDFLFVRREQAPFNAETLGTSVQLWMPEKKDHGWAFALGRSWGVSCLPYRVRITNGGRYDYTGDEALQNFEDGDHKTRAGGY